MRSKASAWLRLGDSVSKADRLGWCRRDEMEAKLSSLPMAERNMLARGMNDIDEDQVRHLHSTNLDSALRPI